MPNPTVSVILPVFNNASTVASAINSILRQTFADFELIIIDDGSTDESFAVAERMRDPRIRLYRNEKNLGVSRTRNRGLALMRGEFMAPMDADDVCRRKRIEWTLRHVREHPSLGLCGGWALWRGWGSLPFVARLPWGRDAVRSYLLFGMPSPHDAILFNVRTLKEHGIQYNEQLRAAVDYDLYRQVARVADVDNVPRVLMEYRCNREGLSNTRGQESLRRRLDGLREELSRLFEDVPDEATLRFHARVGNGGGAHDAEELAAMRDWLVRLEEVNGQRRVFPVEGLRWAAAMVWFQVCRNSAHLGWPAWQAWAHSHWARAYKPASSEWAGFFCSGMLARVSPARRKAQGNLLGL